MLKIVTVTIFRGFGREPGGGVEKNSDCHYFPATAWGK